jgi:hypothetical protein
LIDEGACEIRKWEAPIYPCNSILRKKVTKSRAKDGFHLGNGVVHPYLELRSVLMYNYQLWKSTICFPEN